MSPISSEQKVISVKLPIGLVEWLKAESSRGYRSMNRQVVLLLEQARQAGSQMENAPVAENN